MKDKEKTLAIEMDICQKLRVDAEFNERAIQMYEDLGRRFPRQKRECERYAGYHREFRTCALWHLDWHSRHAYGGQRVAFWNPACQLAAYPLEMK